MIAHYKPTFLHCSRFTPDAVTPSKFRLDNGIAVQVHAPGIIEFTPSDFDSALDRFVLYSCGVHGNETAPIEMCDELVQAILSQQLVIRVKLMVQFGNLTAMNQATRFIDENMNRLFGDALLNPASNPERERAQLLAKTARMFFSQCPKDNRDQKIHYDLHTAIKSSVYPRFAVYPYLHEAAYSRQQMQWLHKAGIEALLLSRQPTTTYSYFSSAQCNAHSFTVELGKVQPFGQNNKADFTRSRSLLWELVEHGDVTVKENNTPIVFDIAQVILRQYVQFSLHFDDATPNFTTYTKGQILASEQSDTGEITNYSVLAEEEAIVFPNAEVALGQRALLTVVKIDVNGLQFD